MLSQGKLPHLQWQRTWDSLRIYLRRHPHNGQLQKLANNIRDLTVSISHKWTNHLRWIPAESLSKCFHVGLTRGSLFQITIRSTIKKRTRHSVLLTTVANFSTISYQTLFLFGTLQHQKIKIAFSSYSSVSLYL
jgi:hypothetical protein